MARIVTALLRESESSTDMVIEVPTEDMEETKRLLATFVTNTQDTNAKLEQILAHERTKATHGDTKDPS